MKKRQKKVASSFHHPKSRIVNVNYDIRLKDYEELRVVFIKAWFG